MVDTSASVCVASNEIDSNVLNIRRTFTWLGKYGDPHRLDLSQAQQEAQQCSDLLSQSNYHQQRAKKKDEEEQTTRRKQDDERRKLREKQMQEEVGRPRATESIDVYVEHCGS
jgi:hypothetical protein